MTQRLKMLYLVAKVVQYYKSQIRRYYHGRVKSTYYDKVTTEYKQGSNVTRWQASQSKMFGSMNQEQYGGVSATHIGGRTRHFIGFGNDTFVGERVSEVIGAAADITVGEKFSLTQGYQQACVSGVLVNEYLGTAFITYGGHLADDLLKDRAPWRVAQLRSNSRVYGSYQPTPYVTKIIYCGPTLLSYKGGVWLSYNGAVQEYLPDTLQLQKFGVNTFKMIKGEQIDLKDKSQWKYLQSSAGDMTVEQGADILVLQTPSAWCYM